MYQLASTVHPMAPYQYEELDSEVTPTQPSLGRQAIQANSLAMQTVTDVVEGLRAVREHSVVEEALQYVEQQAGGKGGPAFVQALLEASPEFIDIWGVWYAQSKQGTKQLTVTVLKVLRALLMVPVDAKDSVHTVGASVICGLHRMANSLVSTELPVCYNFLSSGDVEKAAETLQLLTAAVARSPDVCMAFLCNFNFTLPALPKLSYRPSKKGHARDSDTKNGQQHDAPAPATHECFFNLALAVLRTCPGSGGLKKALQAPQLLPLALQQLTSVDLTSCHLMCEALATRALHQDDPGGKLAFAKILRGRVLHEIVVLACMRSPAGPEGQSTDKEGDARIHKGNSSLQRQCSKLALSVLRAATLEKHLGLWTTADAHLCSVQPVAEPSSCLLPSLLCGRRVKTGTQQRAGDKRGSASLSRSVKPHISAPGSHPELESSPNLHCLEEDDVQCGLLYECRLHCHAAQVLRPGKALQGLASHARFASSKPQLSLLLDMVKLSPELAAVVLVNRDLMPITVDKHAANVHAMVAVACLHSLSQIASPAHQATAASHEQLHNHSGTTCHLGLKAGLFTAFLDSVFPGTISQTTCSKVLEGGSPEHIRATLSIMKGQLQCVWRLAAALRHQARLCSGMEAAREQGIISERMSSEADREQTLHDETCSEQVEKASAVISYAVQKKMPDVKVSKNTIKSAHSEQEQVDKEPEEVCMNIDGMTLKLEDAVPDPSSEEEDQCTLTPAEAQDLVVLLLQVVALHIQCSPHAWAVSASSPWRLLPLLIDVSPLLQWPEAVRLQFLKVLVLSQALPIPCAENAMPSASWSASFLTPVLQHMSECGSNSEDQALCQAIVYSSLCRLQLHSGPDSKMLPWILPLLQESNIANQKEKLDSDAAAAVATFFVGVLTTCVRRPHTPWSALTQLFAAQQDQGTVHDSALGSSTDLCKEAARSGFVLLYSTITAAMGRFRSQYFMNPASDGNAKHSTASSEAAVWGFVASVTTIVLQSLIWGSTAAAVLLEAVLEDIQGSSERLAQVISVSWQPDEAQKPGKKCTVKMSQNVPAACRELLQSIWNISCRCNERELHLQNGVRGTQKAVSGPGCKRKAFNDDGIPSHAVSLKEGHSLTQFVVEQALASGSMQKFNAPTRKSPHELITGVFGHKNSFKHAPAAASSTASCVLGASEEFQALFAAHVYIQSHFNGPHICEDESLDARQLDTARVFHSVLRLSGAQVDFLTPCLLESMVICCKQIQQNPAEVLQEPASKSSKKASGRQASRSNQSNAALTRSRDMAATIVAVALCAVCYRRCSWTTEQSSWVSLLGSEAKNVLAAVSEAQTASHVSKAADCGVYSLCLAALLAAVAAEHFMSPTEPGPEPDTDRVALVTHVARIAQLATGIEPAAPGSTRHFTATTTASTLSQPKSIAAELQRCYSSIVDGAQRATLGVWAPVHTLLHGTCVAFIEQQSLETLACALKELNSSASPQALQSMGGRDICAMFLVSTSYMKSTTACTQHGPDLTFEGPQKRIGVLYGVYTCAGEILEHASAYSAPVQHMATTFLQAFWNALAPDTRSISVGLEAIATCEVASRAASLQLIDSALRGDVSNDVVSAAAQIITCSTAAALHAAQAILMALQQDKAMLTSTPQHGSDDSDLGANLQKYQTVLCALLPTALMHEQDAPELFAVSKQVATLIGPAIHDALVSTAGEIRKQSPGKKTPSNRQGHAHAEQESLSVLAEACMCFHPLKANEVQPILSKIMPPEGLTLACTTELLEAQSQVQPFIHSVSFASRILTGAAQVVHSHEEPKAPAVAGTSRLLVYEPLRLETQVSALVRSFLSSCVNTVSQTVKLQVHERSRALTQSHNDHVAAVFAQLQPFFDVIDKCLGDLIAAQPAAAVESECYKAMAQAAVTHTGSALATMSIGDAWKRASKTATKSSQRLWAAMIRSNSSGTGHEHENEDAPMSADDEDDLSHHNDPLEAQDHDAGCNIGVGKWAMTALGMIMESDEAMELLFDVPATRARCDLPEDISKLDVPLKSVVMLPGNDTHALGTLTGETSPLSEAQYGVAAHALDSQLREALLLLIETLVCCAESHVPTHSSPAHNRKAASLQKQLHRAAQLLLPELLKTYQATMMAEDRACLLVIRALDHVLSSSRHPLEAGTAEAYVKHGFLDSTGYLWGKLWQEVQSWSSLHVPLMDGLLSRPDMVDPRRMALAALHFAGSRTLTLEEQDPFYTASDLSRASQATYCAYDPAFVVPAAAVLLQKQWVCAESVVRAGWMPLLLRCLGADDDGLREAAYAAVACIEESFRQLNEQEQQDASTFREDTQLLSLLTLVRCSIDTPCQKLPRASAVFLAEASVAALNPAASIYSHMNHFLLKRASLQLHGVPMLATLHEGVSGLGSHSQTLARELAIAANSVGHISKVAAQALASPGSLDEAAAVVRGVLAACSAPNTCSKMLQKGVYTFVAGIVSQCLSAIAAAPLQLGVDGETAPHKDVVLVALRTLSACSRTRKLWRAELQHVAAAEFSAVLWSLLIPTKNIANKLSDGTMQSQHKDSVLSWHKELLTSILLEMLCLARTVLVQTHAWHADKTSAVSLTSTFWRTVVDLTFLQIKNICYSQRHTIDRLKSALQQCMLCVPERSWPGSVGEIQPCRPSSSSETLVYHSSTSFTLDLFSNSNYLWSNYHSSRGSGAMDAVVAYYDSIAGEDRWYKDEACDGGEADPILVRTLAWTASAVLQALCKSEQPCTTDVWKQFSGQPGAVRDALCCAGVPSYPAHALQLRASMQSGVVATLVHALDAVQRHWDCNVSDTCSGALQTAMKGRVGDCISEVAAVFGDVAAGVRKLGDVWELQLNTVQGSKEADCWTVRATVQHIYEKAGALNQ